MLGLGEAAAGAWAFRLGRVRSSRRRAARSAATPSIRVSSSTTAGSGRLGSLRARVHHHHPFQGRKAEPARLGLQPRRVKAARAFLRRHPLRPAIDLRIHHGNLAGRQFLQLGFAHAGNAPVAPQPKPAGVVLQDLGDRIVRQPFAGGEGRELPIAPPAQTAAHGADPERALRHPDTACESNRSTARRPSQNERATHPGSDTAHRLRCQSTLCHRCPAGWR